MLESIGSVVVIYFNRLFDDGFYDFDTIILTLE